MEGKTKHIFAILAGVFCFVIYMLTLHPGVGFVDCGELAAACFSFGVPHPTGYPLFLIFGFIVSHLPIGSSAIYRLNVLSAIETAAAVVVTYYSAVIVLENLIPKLSKAQSRHAKQPAKGQSGKEHHKEHHTKESRLHSELHVSSINIYLLAFMSAAAVGLIKTVWFEAIQTEVYALHVLFISIVFYYSIRIFFSLKENNKKEWALLFIFLGLSFANHSTTIYFVPGILYLLYIQRVENPVKFKAVLPYLLLIIPGMLLYLVLFIAASPKPFLNWSDIHDLSSFFSHVRGSEYSHLVFSSASSFSDNAASFLKTLPGDLSLLPGLAGAIGLLVLWKVNKRLFVFSLFLLFTCLLYSFNYKSVEINSFYLLGYYLLVFYSSLGVLFVLNYIGKAKAVTGPKAKIAVIISVAAVCAFSAGYNYKENDNSSNYVNEDMTKNIFSTLEPNSILLAYEYPFVYSSSLYYQQVEKLRPDIKIFLVTFLSAPWYLETIKKYYPDIYANVQTEAEDYAKSYGGDEKNQAAKLTVLLKAFIEKNFGKYPVYLTVDFVVQKDTKKMYGNLVPRADGLVYKLVAPGTQYDKDAGIKSLDVNFRKYDVTGYHKNRANVFTSGMLYETAFYHYNNKNPELALKFTDKILGISPWFRDAVNLKNKILSERK